LPFLDTNGINVYYEVQGEGEPILVIGGLATDLTQLGGIVGTLAGGHQVIAFDNRGAGRTDKPDVPYSIEMMAEDASGVLKALEDSPTDVLGISLGGRVAIKLALMHPDQVKSLILVSTSARGAKRRGILWSLSNALVRIPFVRRIGTKYPQPYFAYVRQREASKGVDASGRLNEIAKPTLILHGLKDRIIPFRLAEETHAGIAGSRLVPFPGGHLFVFSSPHIIAADVEEFLVEQRAQGGVGVSRGSDRNRLTQTPSPTPAERLEAEPEGPLRFQPQNQEESLLLNPATSAPKGWLEGQGAFAG
jgi:pimeloyl-ACP methyl ester carboxylesterase